MQKPTTTNTEQTASVTVNPKAMCRQLLQKPGYRWIFFVLAGLLTGLVLTMLSADLDSQSLVGWVGKLGKPGFWCTALLLGLLITTLNLLAHHLLVGGVLISVLSLGITLVNYYKVAMTITPLSIGDFTLIGNLGSIVGLNSEAIAFSAVTVLVLLLAILWLVALGLLSAYIRVNWKRSAPAGLAVGLGFCLLFWVGLNPLFLQPLQVGADRVMEQVTVNDYCSGPLLGLWRSLYCQMHSSGEEILSAEESLKQAEEYLASLADEEDGETAELGSPNIILIQSESFFDVTKLEGVTYEEDPLAAYHALQEEGVYGTFYTRSLGYGTTNVELEVLTGLNTGLLSGQDLYSYATEVFENLPSVPSLLGDNGYDTTFIHTYNDSIYGRTEIYTALSMQHLYFSSDFTTFFAPLQALTGAEYWPYMNSRISGTYYSDELLTELVIANYEYTRSESDAPVFILAASMENHQPYSATKYSEEEMTVTVTADSLDESAMGILTAFVQGCHNASEALATLVDYYRDCEEPTIIIFYGDHRPGLGLLDSTESVYAQLGIVSQDRTTWTLEDYAQMYTTDFLIWSNYESLLPQAAGTTMDTSCNYLGAVLLEMADIDLPTYWTLISALSESRVIDTVSYHLGTDGTLSSSVPTEGIAATQINLLRQMIASALNVS